MPKAAISPVHCSFCLFSSARPTSPDEIAELEIITIINGQATCLWHAPYVSGGAWSLALAQIQRRLGE